MATCHYLSILRKFKVCLNMAGVKKALSYEVSAFSVGVAIFL